MGSRDEQLGEVREAYLSDDVYHAALSETAIRESEEGEPKSSFLGYGFIDLSDALPLEAPEQEAEGRHEGVQERDEMFHGSLPERRGELDIYHEGDVRGNDERLSDMRKMRIRSRFDGFVSPSSVLGPMGRTPLEPGDSITDDVMPVSGEEECLDRWTCCIHTPPKD